MLKDIHNFDQQMQNTYQHLRYYKTLRKTKIGSFLFCTLVISLAILQYAVDIACFPPQNISYYNLNGIFTYCTPFAVSSIMVLQFTSLLIVINQRFSWINEELTGLKQRWNKKSSNRGRVFDINGVRRNVNFQ